MSEINVCTLSALPVTPRRPVHKETVYTHTRTGFKFALCANVRMPPPPLSRIRTYTRRASACAFPITLACDDGITSGPQWPDGDQRTRRRGHLNIPPVATAAPDGLGWVSPGHAFSQRNYVEIARKRRRRHTRNTRVHA